MRTNIDIDDSLMDSVLDSGYYKTKKEAVEAGLVLLKRSIAQKELLKLKGKISFFDDEVTAKSSYYRIDSSSLPPTKAAEID